MKSVKPQNITLCMMQSLFLIPHDHKVVQIHRNELLIWMKSNLLNLFQKKKFDGEKRFSFKLSIITLCQVTSDNPALCKILKNFSGSNTNESLGKARTVNPIPLKPS